ncbi:glycosyltransferase family 2 protein [Azohydromonas australica]|uniref:glycosyltransferase family 2 protein n=1 Tax=Azohydromonas australica TaxID=364039 RepID=UPI00048DDEAA|nr:glycosyltransferase family A protein [Azohydromonas australica]
MSLRYVLVTPVKDEAAFIRETLMSVKRQTHLPLRWVIVDDGSCDDTPRILREHADDVPWLTVVSTGAKKRKLGSAEVLAFQRGLEHIDPALQYDVVVKLDGDVRLPETYFERVLERMAAAPDWGIVSGVYCEEKDGQWLPVPMPGYHAAGASKVVRRQCFQDIDGFIARKGWDTVDEIRAGLHGWRTGHFEDIQFYHLKPEGQAMGRLSTHRFHGEIYYQTGGGLLFLLLKVAHRMMAGQPRILGGMAMLWGYAVSVLSNKDRLVNREEAQYYRSMLNRRLAAPVIKLITSLNT